MQKYQVSHYIILALLISVFLSFSALVCLGCSSSVSSVPQPNNTAMENINDRASGVDPELLEPFWVLIMGGDTRANTLEGSAEEPGTYNLGYSDTMMLAYIVPAENRITLVTIPRDSEAAPIEGYEKINAVLRYGYPEDSVKAVQTMTGIDEIKYYFATDFSRFVNAVDTIGGVDVVAPIDVSFYGVVHTQDSITIPQGENHLDGESALVFSRARKIYANDLDACRQIQDRQVIQNIITAGLAAPEDVRDIYVKAVKDFVDTNMTQEELKFYVDLFAGQSMTFYSGSMPYEGGLGPDGGEWRAPYDEAVWKEVISTVEAGGDPCDVVPLPYVAAA